MSRPVASVVTTVNRIYLIVALFVAIIVGLVLYFQVQMDAAVGIRAFIGGEGLWAKAQKDAVIRLGNYGHSGDEADYQTYLDLIKVPLGYRSVRQELQKSKPDWDLVRVGCRQGGLHPVDTEYAIQLFRRFQGTEYMTRAIGHWSRGDRLIAELMNSAEQLHQEVAGGRARPAVIHAIETRLAELNGQLKTEEDQFSATLAEASRWANDFSRVLTYAAAILFVALGIALSWSIIKRIRITENALIESEGRYRSIFERVSDVIYTIAADGRFTSVSPSCKQMVGWLPADLVGRSFADVTHPDDLARAEEVFRTTLAGQPAANVEVRMTTRSGEYIEGEHCVVPLISGGSVKAVLGIARDITARKQAEAELISARQTAENANQGKTRFLAAASHDLRQPLQAIGLLQETLARTGLNERQTKINQHLGASVKSLGELLNKLLDISRLDADMIKAQPVEIDALDLVEAIDTEFGSLARTKSLRLDFHWPRQGLVVFSDTNLLVDLMRNLVSNAIKYTEKGGVLVSLRRRQDRALIQVWDSGIGIGPEHLDLIFEEYFQVGNPERHRAKGVGLGLAIVRRLGELLGTGVTCRSRVGRGSVFEISLPLAKGRDGHAWSAQASATLAVGACGRFAGKRIIVIEDDPAAAEALRLSLETQDMQVTQFGTAEEALDNASAMAADYYISDYRLPGMNGLQLLDAIQMSSGRPINAVLLTGDTSPDCVDNLTQSSRWTVLYKPIDLPRLLSAMAS